MYSLYIYIPTFICGCDVVVILFPDVFCTKIINRGIQITENCHHLLTTREAKARRTRGVANNLGTTSDSWERQVEASASGVP